MIKTKKITKFLEGNKVEIVENRRNGVFVQQTRFLINVRNIVLNPDT